ncbi:porin family protein [Sinomicrobium weinanense]|uniref:PorT family protein n=1 Tax=Sinomicrobium weinanense TaxID=2842200 RepID=A0A926JNQ0_9FLAO|nr:porin family protein [Sinomicrobium weinanense]MBC9794534.1 PorT family protein [Sinomicrobium weinanense]MBU3124441.1 PorT family protein [Sinomicrobium weinanense]
MKVRLYIVLITFGLYSWNIYSQEEITADTTVLQEEKRDDKYKEDQVYIGATYNILLNRPSDVKQNNLSRGIQLGVVKDMPLNKRRNIALGIGIGYAYNVHFHNLQFFEGEGGSGYRVIPDSVDYKRNKVDTHLIEMPIEFRWRTSTADSYKFWRVYTGIKLGYVFANRYKFIADNKTRFTNDDISRFQAGLHLSVGYNTWNFYAYYGLGKLFKGDTETDTGESLDMSSLKIGIIFYAL